MPTFRATPGLTLTPKQQAALTAAIVTPAVTESLQRITDQMLEPMAPTLAAFRRRIAEAITTPVERAHAEHVERSRRLISDAFGQVATTRVSVATAPDLQPMLDRVAKQQHAWAQALAIPLAQGFSSAAWPSAATADWAAAWQRVRVVSPLPIEVPDLTGLDRLAELVSEGRFDAATLAVAETQVAGDAEISEAIDETAEALAAQRPERSAAQWRTAIVVEVWAMWLLALVALGVVVPTELVTAISLAVGKAAQVTGEAAGRWVDRRTITGQDVEDP